MADGDHSPVVVHQPLGLQFPSPSAALQLRAVAASFWTLADRMRAVFGAGHPVRCTSMWMEFRVRRCFVSSLNEGVQTCSAPTTPIIPPALTLHTGRFLSLFLLVYCLIPSPKPSPVAAVSSLKLPIRYPHGQLFFTREDRSIRPLPLPYLPSSNLHLPLWPRL